MEEKLERLLKMPELTFQQRLLQLIEESGMDYITFYKKTGMDRKLFSQIKLNEDYRPKKKTIVAMIFTLKLDLQNAQDLLARAGYAFSPVDTFDRIVCFYIENNDYNVRHVNNMLARHHEPQLGGGFK